MTVTIARTIMRNRSVVFGDAELVEAGLLVLVARELEAAMGQWVDSDNSKRVRDALHIPRPIETLDLDTANRFLAAARALAE